MWFQSNYTPQSILFITGVVNPPQEACEKRFDMSLKYVVE